jgi:hypothetical protein
MAKLLPDDAVIVADVRGLPGLPAGRWIVRVEPAPEEDFATEADPLLCAAILGLSSTSFFAPERPVVWTNDRLARAAAPREAA